MTTQLLTPEKINWMQRQQQAIEMRIAGKTFVQIAEALGYADHTGAIGAVRSAMESMLPAPCEHLRGLLTARLEVIWARLYPKFVERMDGDGEVSVRTLKLIDTMVKVTLAHGKLAGLEQQGLVMPGRDEDDVDQATPAPAKPRSREEQLSILIERLKERQAAEQAKRANAAVDVTQVVDHEEAPP